MRLWYLPRKSGLSTLGQEILPQVEDFKYFKLFFTSEGRMKQGFYRGLSVNANAILVAKRELSQKEKI